MTPVDTSAEAVLVRVGLQWNGPREFVCTPMPDGYWTPWHIAHEVLTAAQQRIAEAHSEAWPANWLTEDEDQLRERLSRIYGVLSPGPHLEIPSPASDVVVTPERDAAAGQPAVASARAVDALNSARRCLREVRAAIAVDAKGWPIEFERGEHPVIDLIDDELAKEE